MDSTALLAELCGLVDRHARDTRIPIPGLGFARATAPNAPTSSVARPTLALVAQGAKRVAVGKHVCDYRPGQYLVVSMDLPVTGHFIEASREAPLLGVGFDLRPELIASLILEEQAGGAATRLRNVPDASRALAVNSAPASLLDAIVRLVRLLDAPEDRQVLAPMIEREISWRLLRGDLGDVVRQIGLADSSLSHIGRSIRWIREHHVEPFRIEELADRAGMSASTFHRHFRAVTAMSPVQFQKKVRLQQARLLLLGRGVDVAGAGFAVGYDSASQFSREYRREFGAPPGRDVARLRGDDDALSSSVIP